MPDWIRMLLSSALGTFGFGLLVHAPRRAWIPASLLGALTFFMYWGMASLGVSDAMATFLASVTGSLVALLFARKIRMIGTVFLMMSIISFVPGLGLYRSMRFLGAGENGAGADQGVQAMIIIAMIVLGQGVGSFLFRAFHHRHLPENGHSRFVADRRKGRKGAKETE